MTDIVTHRNRIAVVTGAGRGIGAAMALEFARRGAKVVAVDLKDPSVTVQTIGPNAIGVAADVSDPLGWAAIDMAAKEAFGDVDIVVNNAAYYPNHAIDDLDFETWRRTMSVNLDAQFLSAKQFVPGMRRKKWGRFVGISSNSIGLTVPGMSHYMASKMGIMGFMRGLANDVADDGITCNAVLPGLTHTVATEAQGEEQRRATWQTQAIKRFAEPEDIVGPVMFLTTDDAAFMTGQALVVDGGQYRVG
ncbi:SDR family NAD(P)-dependent oxidoreductase [Asticcacaulis sp. SL142]|uniref:SDR family NAD(P)-dependent oxidoreductase n=1 Tax=Asticcacaulis sp. SL142 TaxID=2995155 RepID=UPI00226D3A40|nr:SDR family oxidoreductase [Asticcacaulis sp. SL142]WAC48230.1 SDR family NAD(P)-dependent oxidoreductase [Asticcacaulis sp. SL142]